MGIMPIKNWGAQCLHPPPQCLHPPPGQITCPRGWEVSQPNPLQLKIQLTLGVGDHEWGGRINLLGHLEVRSSAPTDIMGHRVNLIKLLGGGRWGCYPGGSPTPGYSKNNDRLGEAVEFDGRDSVLV